MAVKRISINWVAKLNDSKDLPKYGDTADIAAKSTYPHLHQRRHENEQVTTSAASRPSEVPDRRDGDIDLALGNYNYGPDKAIFVPDFLMKTWERSGPPVMILYNTLHSKPAKR